MSTASSVEAVQAPGIACQHLTELRGIAQPVRQLRDPAVYEEGERLWLLYAVQGESGIAIAEIARRAST